MTNKTSNHQSKDIKPQIPKERRGASPGTASPSELVGIINPGPLVPAQSPKK